MGLLDLFRKAAPVRNPADQPPSPIGVWDGERRQAVTYLESVKAEEALKHPAIYRCLSKLCSATSSVDWYCEQDPDVPPSDRVGPSVIKAINSLLQSPSEIWTRSQLIYWMTLNYACYGRVPFKVGVSAVAPNNPTGIYPLTARFVETKKDKKGIVVAYVYGQGSDQQTWPTRKAAE